MQKRPVLFTMLFILLVSFVNAQLADSVWPMFHGNLQHTGLSPYDTSHVDGTVKWVFKADKGMESSPAIGSDGTIYVGSHDNRLYAINPDGTEKWHFQVGTGPVFSKSGTEGYDAWKGIISSPAIADDGTIYFTSMSNKLFALNPDGTEKWNYNMELSVDIWSSPAIGSDGTVYVGSHDNFNGRLYAINPDGTEKWSFQTGSDISSSPAIGKDGIIYIATGDHHLYALYPDGKKKWGFAFPDFADSSPAIADDGTIYVGSTREGALYAINHDGTKKWSLKLGSSIDVWSSPAIGSDGTAYIGADDNNLYAVNSDGTIKWKFAFDGDGGPSPAIGSDGTIYMSCDCDSGKSFFAINPDGTEKWSVSQIDAASSPAIGKDGTVYIGTWSGLYAFGNSSSAMKEDKSGIDELETDKNSPIKSGPVFGQPHCQSGGLITSVYKDYQMLYPEEDFIRVNDIDALKDLTQLKGLTCLQYMDATDRNITGNIANLDKLKNLEVFSLYSNPEVFGDICSLAGAVNLRSLKFAFDPKITGDISCLKDLTKLETFAMTHTRIYGDLSVFANMPNLKAIYVSGTNVTGDICAFSKLTNLEELGIADEYPGNPDITGDLSCLDSLQKLKRVSIYNTGTTNCEQFTKNHPDLAKTVTESGKQGGGGCSKESMKTLVDYAQKYERKISKEVQTEVRGKPDYNKPDVGRPEECFANGEFIGQEECRALMDKTSKGTASSADRGQLKEPDQRNFVTKFIDWVKSLFGWKSKKSIDTTALQSDDRNQIMPQALPGGCRSQAECDDFCSKQENQEECSKFAPQDEGPPKECTVDGKFIGEAECRAMMEQGFSGNKAPSGNAVPGSSDNGPPKECTVDGQFIGEEKCKAMMESAPSGRI